MSASKCCICNAPNSKVCSRCRSVRYCSSECQRSDWKIHKVLCKAFGTLSPRPSDQHKLGVLFPDDENKPRPVWIHFKTYIGCEMFDTGTFFGVGNSVERIVLGDSKLRGFELPNKLCIYHHSEFVYDDFRPNRCIKKLAAGGVTYNWKGPFLALRSKDDLSDFAEDATLADFSHIVEYFATYAKPVVVRGVRDPNLRPKKGMIRGVRIVPASSGKDGSNPFTFEAVDIARDHAVFRGTAAPLSMRVRFPIMAVPIKQTISVGPGTVSPAALLYQEYDASSENWGAPPGEWFLGEGGAIAVAFGTHTLNPSDLEALCAFAEDEVLPRQYATMMDGSKKDTLVNFITEENFGAYAMRFFAGALNRSPLPQMTWVPVSGTGKWMPSMRQ